MKRISIAGMMLVGALSGVPLFAAADHYDPATMSVEAAMTGAECVIQSNLSHGMRSAEVTCLQKHLIEDGLLKIGGATGYFGDLTKAAVMAWQKEKGLPETGYFGALSREAFSGHMSEDKEVHTNAPAMGAHAPLDITSWPMKPTVAIELHPDTMSGYNLEVKTENFRFAPEHVNTAVVANEGHAHVYVDGKKIARLYGNWMHLPKELFVGVGDHHVLVTLNANDHSDLAHGGTKIEAKGMVTTK